MKKTYQTAWHRRLRENPPRKNAVHVKLDDEEAAQLAIMCRKNDMTGPEVLRSYLRRCLRETAARRFPEGDSK